MFVMEHQRIRLFLFLTWLLVRFSLRIDAAAAAVSIRFSLCHEISTILVNAQPTASPDVAPEPSEALRQFARPIMNVLTDKKPQIADLADIVNTLPALAQSLPNFSEVQ